MNFESESVYHVYNRGNQHQSVFFKDADYMLFLRKIREQLLPVADILAWCLMPNHFHLMICANDKGCSRRISGSNEIQELSYRMGIMLSSYASVINKEHCTDGSLFQKKTKAKLIDNQEYMICCMHYIHQNPMVAGLTDGTLEDWKYSSFSDYAGLRKGTLCNYDMLFELTGYDQNSFMKDSYHVIDPDIYRFLY